MKIGTKIRMPLTYKQQRDLCKVIHTFKNDPFWMCLQSFQRPLYCSLVWGIPYFICNFVIYILLYLVFPHDSFKWQWNNNDFVWTVLFWSSLHHLLQVRCLASSISHICYLLLIKICGLQLPRERQRSTRLLQLTGR